MYICIYIYIYIYIYVYTHNIHYIYIYIYIVALLVQRYLSNTASFVLCVFPRGKDRHNLLHDSAPLKKSCVRQVGLDKCF